MSNKKRKLLKTNLITFLTLFDGKPNMLVEYLMEYDTLQIAFSNGRQTSLHKA